MTPEYKRLMKADARATSFYAYAVFLEDTYAALCMAPTHDLGVLTALRPDVRRAYKRAGAAYKALVGLMEYSAVHYGLGFHPACPQFAVTDLTPYARHRFNLSV